MSKEYEGRDLMDIAAKAEQDLNDQRHKFGTQEGTGFGGKTVGGGSTSTDEGGIDQRVTNEFPGSTAEYTSRGTIPPSEGGDVQKGSGKTTKAGDFDQGFGGEGPEDVTARQAADRGGDDDIRSNIRQHAPQKHTS